MASRYASFSRAQFERELIGIRQENKLRGWRDATEELEMESGEKYWEHVYVFPTYDNNIDVIIYSSVDRRTGRTRDHGTDAVRVIYRRRMESGRVVYKKIKKHLRLTTLFENLDVTLYNANFDVAENELDMDRGWYGDLEDTF